ncbi:MAG: AMP-binding protein [Chloroflexales bacterium]
MNTADYLLSTSDSQRVAVIESGERYSYADVYTASAAIARALTALAVQPQQHVAIYGPNSFFWVAAYLAILKLGAVAVPFSPTAKPAQLDEMQNLVACRAVCLQAKHLSAAIHKVFRTCDLITDAVLAVSPEAENVDPVSGTFARDQIAALMLTSGTTARPRAVRVSHRNLQANTESIIAALDIEPDDRMMVVLPFHYCFGTSLLHTHLRVGASLVLASNSSLPEFLLNEIETNACTSLAGVPSLYQMLLRGTTFPRRSLPTLRKFQQAGGKLSSALIEELADLRPEAQIFIMYGQTEATARLSYLPPAYLRTKLGSIGRGLPGVELRVVDDLGQDVRPGEVGQIIARGDNITAGYLNEPDATARTFVDGALHTGDMATVDDDGFISIVDRQNDFIKPLGRRVSSHEIEACVLALPEIISAAAVGIPDQLLGEAIKVYVTLREDAQLDVKAIIDHCRGTLPRYMIPKAVVILDQMPMNSQGKVLKTALREL